MSKKISQNERKAKTFLIWRYCWYIGVVVVIFFRINSRFMFRVAGAFWKYQWLRRFFPFWLIQYSTVMLWWWRSQRIAVGIRLFLCVFIIWIFQSQVFVFSCFFAFDFYYFLSFSNFFPYTKACILFIYVLYGRCVVPPGVFHCRNIKLEII